MNDDGASLLADIEELVRAGDLELALDRLKTAAHGSSARLYDEVVLQQARAGRLARDYRRGVLLRDHFEADTNRLSVALLSLAKDVARAVPAPPQQQPPAAEAIRAAPPAAALEALEEIGQQKILGINNLKQISWIGVGLAASRSVCRILTPTSRGTGFLVGDGILMTNNHVIGTADMAAQSQAEFDYQQDQSGGFLPTTRYQLDPAAGFHTSVALDYTFVRVRPDGHKPPLSTWGVLKLNPNADPIPSEHVIVIQHPNGGYKQIVLTANFVVAAAPPLLHYTTDTMPGSSGSPVFNDSWHVIAIHHFGGTSHRTKQGSIQYVNEGVLMSAIRAAAGEHWPQ